MTYALFHVPEAYETEHILLLAPYFDVKFITTLLAQTSPKSLSVVVDDGTPSEELASFIHQTTWCDSVGGDEAVGSA